MIKQPATFWRPRPSEFHLVTKKIRRSKKHIENRGDGRGKKRFQDALSDPLWVLGWIKDILLHKIKQEYLIYCSNLIVDGCFLIPNPRKYHI